MGLVTALPRFCASIRVSFVRLMAQITHRAQCQSLRMLTTAARSMHTFSAHIALWCSYGCMTTQELVRFLNLIVRVSTHLPPNQPLRVIEGIRSSQLPCDGASEGGFET